MRKNLFIYLFIALIANSSGTMNNSIGRCKRNNISNNTLTTSYEVKNPLDDKYDWCQAIGEYANGTILTKLHRTRQVGKTYKVYLATHRQVVEYGTDFEIGTEVLEEYKRQVVNAGDNNLFEFNESSTTTHSYTNSVTTSIQVKMGIEQIVKASIQIGNTANVGTETKLNTQVIGTIDSTITYSSTVSVCKATTVKYDLNTCIPHDQREVSYGLIGCYLKAPIYRSYTQEKTSKGWNTLSNTIKSGYYSKYYFGTLETFYYPNKTFGAIVLNGDEEYYDIYDLNAREYFVTDGAIEWKK